jgi:hypothetical protein
LSESHWDTKGAGQLSCHDPEILFAFSTSTRDGQGFRQNASAGSGRRAFAVVCSLREAVIKYFVVCDFRGSARQVALKRQVDVVLDCTD